MGFRRSRSAYTSTRTARVEATTPFTAVLAPVGEEWLVVGAIVAGG